MKHITCLFMIVLFTTSCKHNKAAKKPLTEDQKTPTATFMSETLGLTHCESAVYDVKNNIIYASLIGNKEKGDGSIATIDLDGKLIDATFISALNDPKGIAITENRLYVSDITELVEVDLTTREILKNTP
ncbi:hypothetical protein [Gelidibacter mesophilus]|uniref:hypothetical protein n=1 Tax=Gelidibacter mesophilus TaxID=169050 RepID=UPI0012F923DD|nr:hypothetical protein [Gelidibacter mesophilus]